MKTQEAGPSEELASELLDLLLDEAERALLLADARIDEPGHRLLTGQASDDDEAPPGVAELRLAAAELIDAHPGIQLELERLSDRVRTLGPSAAAQQLSNKPHVLDLARLSLEAFFRCYRDSEAYQHDLESRGIDLEDGRSPEEQYLALAELLAVLRGRMN